MAAVAAPVALVTGASRGIGRAIARQLAARGVRVAVHFRRNRAAARATLASLPGAGHALFAADLTAAPAAERLVAAVLRTFGRIDVLVNNAGIYELHPPEATGLAAWRRRWDRTVAANLTAPAHLSFLVARAMRRARGGRIVNISSRGAFRGEPRAPAYGAAKAGLNAFGQSLAKALAPRRIYVFTLAPGWVDTDMAAAHLHGPRGPEILRDIPLGRVATATEVAQAAAWFALDAPASMTGCIVDLNGASYLRT
ncbi:MAG TPA: SDR family oxidoreductase [Opitutaceae bacterium]|nr:SDR family oxidoreductase [Opitutaceae bacterium]